jgi:hypothetical protein
MTSIKRDVAARRRGELNRTSVGRRLPPAIDPQRRVNSRRPDRPWIGARRVGLRGPRYEYLTHSHDQDRLGHKTDEINRELRACG